MVQLPTSIFLPQVSLSKFDAHSENLRRVSAIGAVRQDCAVVPHIKAYACYSDHTFYWRYRRGFGRLDNRNTERAR